MNQEDLQSLKHWFDDYCAAFATPVREDQQNFDVKQEHTHEVCLNAVRIARDLNLGKGDLLLAETTALFHDVGRFPQYQQYKTFKDSISVNHAALGAKVLLETRVLTGLPGHEQDLIIKVITLHNVFSLPDGLDDTTLLIARLVRDADKLDIWRVVTEYYGHTQETRATAVGLGLEDGAGYSQEILAAVQNGELARISGLRTLNDLKLVQLSWIYDLNFAESLRMVKEGRYIDRIAAYLPADGGIGRAVRALHAYVEQKLT